MRKCNSSSQPRVGAEGEGEGPRVQRLEVWDWGSRRADPAVRAGGRQRPTRTRARARAGLTCVVPRSQPAPSLAIPSEAPEISVLSACGNVVCRKVAPRPRAPAPPPPSPPPPLPRPPPLRPPLRTGRAAVRQPQQTWSGLRDPLGRNLGRLGLEAASHSRSWSPGAARASGSCSGAGGKSWPGLESPLRGQERTCRSAWSKDCSVAGGGECRRQLPAALGTRAGWGPRD